MKIVLFTVAGSPPILGNVVDEQDPNFITISHPLAIMKETPNIYSFQYMPFAKDGLVVFKANNIICLSSVSEEVEQYYKEMVDLYKSQKIVYKIADEAEKEPTASIKKPRLLH